MKSLARRMLAFAITGAFAAFFVERTLTPAGRSAGFTVGVAPSSGGISWRGWRRILSRAVLSVNDDRLFSLAAGIAFYGILSLVPAVTVFVSIYGLLADPRTVISQLAPLISFLPEAAGGLVIEQAKRIASSSGGSLSASLLLGLAIASWSANAAVKAMFEALNVIYGESEKRSFLRFNALALSVTIGAAILMVLAILLVASEPLVVSALPAASVGVVVTILTLARWPLFLLLGALSTAFLYRIGPSRKSPEFAPLWPGAIAAAALWGASSAGFAWYVTRLGNYQAVYGSLATVAIFLTWVWLSATAVLFGGKINAEAEREARGRSAPP